MKGGRKAIFELPAGPRASEFGIPTAVIFGSGSLLEIDPPEGPILFVVSESVATEVVEELADRWHARGHEVITVVKPPGEPESADVDRVAAGVSGLMGRGDLGRGPQSVVGLGDAARGPRSVVGRDDARRAPRSVVGLGGGSALDFAKGLAALNDAECSITDFEFGREQIGTPLPLYLAPSTCGSGSEVTPYAVFTNTHTRRKFTLAHPALRAVSANVDPDLLDSLPPGARLGTSLDAFTHCLEALLNRAGPGSATRIAEAGLQIAWRRIKKVNLTREDLVDLSRLSVYGGVSISHRRTGLIHTLSVAFSSLTSVSHGILNTHLLPFAISHNLPGYSGLLSAVVSKMTGRAPSTDQRAMAELTAWTRSLVGSTLPFSGESVRKNQDDLVARILQDSGLPGVSHAEISASTLRSLVLRIADAA